MGAGFAGFETAGYAFEAMLNNINGNAMGAIVQSLSLRGILAPGGHVYCEVPDAPAAAAEGPGREEFFIEHLHVFSPASLAMAAARAGLSPVRTERLHEPSGKWTIAAFLAVAP